MYHVGAFANKFFVSEAFVSDMLHHHLRTAIVPDEMPSRRTVVVAGNLLVKVTI